MIDDVRQAVLYILNKDNNGYITPDEFNKYANMAQLEIFEEYFERYNKYVNRLKAGQINEGYADLVKQMDQAIDYFTSNVLISKSVEPATFVAKVASGSIVGITITNSGGGYPPSTTGQLVISAPSVGGTQATASYTIDGLGNVSSVTITNAGTLYLAASVSMPTSLASTTYNLPDDWYLINVVYYNGNEVQHVEQQKLNYLLNSNLTAPTARYPYYVMHGNHINVYPTTISTPIELYYIRYPKTPNWTFEMSVEIPVFNGSDPLYQDFEISESEFYKIVVKILEYSGVQIREAEVVQYASNQEQVRQQQQQ
jgi:hypothetical protein